MIICEKTYQDGDQTDGRVGSDSDVFVFSTRLESDRITTNSDDMLDIRNVDICDLDATDFVF